MPPKGIPVTQPLPALTENDRITLVLNIHHEHRGDDPRSVQCTTHRLLKTELETWSHRIDVPEEWTSLLSLMPGCWIAPEDIGMLVIENREGRHRTVNPSDEEKAETEKKVIEVGDAIVWPGFPYPLCPRDVASLNIRSQHGITKCRVTVIPR